MAKLPLEDIKVIELGFVWAGPLFGRIMGDMGAQVIKVESIQHIDPSRGSIPPVSPFFIWPAYKNCEIQEPSWESGGTHHEFNRNKMDITLNLSRPKGQELFKKLVKISDVVMANYAPGDLKKFNIDYEALKEVNPSIILLSSTGWGETGPEAKFKAFGPLVEGMSGLTSLTGYPDPEPAMRSGIDWGDMPGPVIGVGLTLAALHYRRQTGKGQFIDLSQRETCTGLIGEAVVGYSMNKENPPRYGNHHQSFAPYNVYPCQSGPLTTPAMPPSSNPEPDKHWLTIAVRTDDEWKGLCRVLGEPDWSKDDKFSTAPDRLKNQDELDEHISKFTSQKNMQELMFALQGEGVPAGGVFNTRDLYEDPHLRARNFWVEVEHPITGVEIWDDMFVKLSKTPGNIRMPAPTLGQHNEYVLKEMLGVSDKEYEELERDNYIGTIPLVAQNLNK